MKTNISGLMSIIADEEKNLKHYLLIYKLTFTVSKYKN